MTNTLENFTRSILRKTLKIFLKLIEIPHTPNRKLKQVSEKTVSPQILQLQIDRKGVTRHRKEPLP